LFDELGPERIEAMKIVGLRDEIRRRWPSDQFGPPSKKLIGPMATFLRSLEAKRGGAKRQRPADDLLDPQTSSHRGLGQQSGGRPGMTGRRSGSVCQRGRWPWPRYLPGCISFMH
jgi:hypothetical protein